jgi:DNA-binding transcriptional MocR family regulator
MSQPMPMYRHIAVDLRRQIEDGELPPGAQLPSEGELRDKYGQEGKMASRNTIRDAIQLLISLGLVETRPGQGTFVLRKVQPFVTTLSGRSQERPGRRRGHQLPVGGQRAGQEAVRQSDPGGDTGSLGRDRRGAVGEPRAPRSSADTRSATSTALPGR